MQPDSSTHKTFVTIGASNHCNHERMDNDYYATEPKAVELLLQREKFSEYIWEPAVGGGHIANILCQHGYKVFGSDIVDRGYPETKIINFLQPSIGQTDDYKQAIWFIKSTKGDIITNPPYSLLDKFIEKSMSVLTHGHKLAMFVRIQAIEGQGRRKIYEKYPIKTIYVPSKRLKCYMGGEDTGGGSAICYAWFVWEKGFSGDTTIKWLD